MRCLAAIAVALALAFPARAQSDKPSFVPEAAKSAAAEGNAAFGKGDYGTARHAYERVLKILPDDPVALVNLGLVEFTSGNETRAEELLKKAVRVRMETAPAWLTLGMIYSDQDRLEEATAALSQAVLYDPQSARARNFYGAVLGRRGWHDAAQSELRRAVELDPTYADAQFNLAALYIDENPPAVELARRHYTRALELGAKKDPEIEKVLNSNPPPQ